MGGWRLGTLLAACVAVAGCGADGGEREELAPDAYSHRSAAEHAVARGSGGGRDGLPVACVTRAKTGGCPTRTGQWYYDYRDNSCRQAGATDCGYTLFDSRTKCVKYCGARP